MSKLRFSITTFKIFLLNILFHGFIPLAISVLQNTPMPKHVGLIMDGNRRFAKVRNVNSIHGHLAGFRKLEQILEYCLSLGIHCVSIYAFSIENFKRPAEEVEMLMNLFREKLRELSVQNHVVKKYKVKIRILGDLSLLPLDVQEEARLAMLRTQNYNKSILNICVPYTSRHEMTCAIQNVLHASVDGKLDIHKLSITDFEHHLMTMDCPPLDLLIRTSGETRLSDFMLYQCSKDCLIAFATPFWPDFSFWSMFSILLSFQAFQWRRLNIK